MGWRADNARERDAWDALPARVRLRNRIIEAAFWAAVIGAHAAIIYFVAGLHG